MPNLLYLDSSAFLDRVLGQKRHHEVTAKMREHAEAGGLVVSSRLLSLEGRRVIVREGIEGDDAERFRRIQSEVRALPLTESIWAEAHDIPFHVKTLDAIHLASCKVADAELLSSDGAMVDAATRLGIRVAQASDVNP